MRIAIIGGGAATIALLHQLINKLSGHNNSEICIIEQKNEIGPGLAYSTHDHAHILNVRAKIMSAMPDDPEHFFRWACENKNKWQKDFPTIDIEKCEFPPRALFGIYLKNVFATLIEKAASKDITVKTFTAHEAVDLKKEPLTNTFSILFSDPNTIPLQCDKVVLNLGHLDSENYTEYKSNDAYLHSPWPIENLKKIPKESVVFIAGTRLTAIDTVLSLKSNGHAGKIILGSGRGLLPCVKGKTGPHYNRKYFTLENIMALTHSGTRKLELLDIFSLLSEEIQEDTLPTLTISAVEFLKSEISKANQATPRHWQNILYSFFSEAPMMWNALSESAKALFLSQYFSAWMIYTALFPLQNALKMLTLLEHNEIEIKSGFKAISYSPNEKKFHISFEADEMPLKADYFINATGSGHNMEKTPSLLLTNLIKNKLLTPYYLGGINVEFETLHVISDTHINGLYAMGDSLTFGKYLATADLDVVNKQACRIADNIVA